MVIHGSYTSSQRTDDFLNGVFGFSLSETRISYGTPLSKTADAAGTQFSDDPASILAGNGTTVLASPLPAGSKAIYTTGTSVAVALIPYGAGDIAFLGWDWFDALPAPGVQDGGWLQVLDSAVDEVMPSNAPPTANPDLATASEDGPAATIDLTSNDVDPDLTDDLEIQSTDTSATTGSVTINADNDTVSYDPSGQFEYLAAGETAVDTFSYTVSDGNGGTDTALVTVTITGENDAPIADDETYETDEDHALAVDATSGLLVGDTDIDASDTLFVAGVTTPAEGGTVAWNADGSFTYTPAEDFNGIYIFTYVVSDGNGGTDTGEVTITVHSVLDAVIDIKPCSDPNSVNLGSKGVLPVAILSTSSTSVFEDDLLFAPDLLAMEGIEFLFGDSGSDHAKVSPLRVAVEDVNGDGIDDLIFHFDMKELTADPGTGEKPALDAETVDAVLTAEWGGTAGGVDLGGSDSVRIVPPIPGNGNGNGGKKK